MAQSNTPLNADDELRREIVRNLWMVFADADWERTPKQWQHNGSLDVSEATEELLALILADRKKHELQAKKNGFYMAAGLFGLDISRVEELWDKCEQELESYE